MSTKSQKGETGTWLIDPVDFTVAASGGDMTGPQLLPHSLAITLLFKARAVLAARDGDVKINDSITWSSGNKLTIDAYRNIAINADIIATGAGSLAFITGRG